MWLTQSSIKRPLAVIMAFLAVVVLGYKSMKLMPVDQYPKVDIPYISITTVYPGASPQEIETLISKPLEESVASVNRVKEVRSTSMESVSMVLVEFQIGANLDVAASDIRDRIDTAKSLLPDDSQDPIIYKVDLGAAPVIYLGVTGQRKQSEIKHIADNIIKDRLGKVDGVAAVSVSGGDTREIFVKVDQERLKAHGVNILEITQALGMANLNAPAGTLRQGTREFSVRLVGEFNSPQQIQEMKLKRAAVDPRLPSGVVELKDVATVLDTTAERLQFTRENNQECVGITVTKQADANTVKVVDGIYEEMEELTHVLPADIKISVSSDNSIFIRDSLHDVTMHLMEGAILATLVVFIFLHIFRATFIIILAIPTSIMAAFMPIHAMGFSLNSITLMALALSIGILVDDSIVVLENIFRHLTMGKTPEQAALDGRMEIGGAAVAITMVDVVVFVPIAFMGGIVGMFFREFGLTIATATLFSLIVSFTLTPMLASRLIREEDALTAEGHGGRKKKGFGGWFDRNYKSLEESYRSTLKWTLRRRWLVVIAGNAILLLSFGIVKFMGFEFMPQVDEGQFSVNVEMQVGTDVRETNRAVAKVEAMLLDKKKYPEVDNIFTEVGAAAGTVMGAGDRGSHIGQVMVRLVDKTKRKRTVWDITEDLSRDMAAIPGPVIRISAGSQRGKPGQKPISLELNGGETAELAALSKEIKKIVDSTPGTRDSEVSLSLGKPEYQVVVDRLRAAQYGISIGQIAMTLRNSIEGNTDIKYRERGDEYNIRIRLDEKDRQTREDVENIILGGALGRNILIKDVADVITAEGPTKLERKNRQRLVTIGAELSKGYDLGTTTAKIQKNIEKEVRIPDGVTLFFGGEAKEMKESGMYMISALGLAVLLVYMLMVALYESLLYPFIIMFSLPQALTGALWALFLTNHNMSMVAMIGVIMLMGLVAKNAILMVDYTNTLRKNGMNREDALAEAGPTRLRPILMTTFTIILGNIPIAMGLGRGAEFRAPMSVGLIGGLLVSLLLTLLVIPATYSIMDDIGNFLTFKKKPTEAK